MQNSLFVWIIKAIKSFPLLKAALKFPFSLVVTELQYIKQRCTMKSPETTFWSLSHIPVNFTPARTIIAIEAS